MLVVRLSALGDVLFTLPAVEALRRARPNWVFHWAIEDRAASLLDLVPSIARRIVYPRRAMNPRHPLRMSRALLEHRRSLREERYDLVLDFQGNLKSSLHALIGRGERRFGFGAGHTKEKAHWWTQHTVVPDRSVVHRVDKAMALARAVLPELPSQPPHPDLVVPIEARLGIEAKLDALGIPASEPFVALHPGTSAFGAFKRWSPSKFAQVGDALAAQGMRTLVTWGPGEESLAREVEAAAHSEHAVRVAPATASLAELAALLHRAKALVGSDSAPLHLAALLGTPVVALFGPKDPAHYGPRFAQSRIVRVALHCSPCTRRRCPDALCMQDITASMVTRALLDLCS